VIYRLSWKIATWQTTFKYGVRLRFGLSLKYINFCNDFCFVQSVEATIRIHIILFLSNIILVQLCFVIISAVLIAFFNFKWIHQADFANLKNLFTEFDFDYFILSYTIFLFFTRTHECHIKSFCFSYFIFNSYALFSE
jgi:hypothetical protein